MDCEESWAPKNWCSWTMVLEKTLESPLDCKEIQPVRSTGDQPWDFFGRNDAEAETPVLWPPRAKSWLIGKDSDAGRDWGQEEKGMTKDEMFGWHHRLEEREFEWTPGVGDGQGGLACCDSWGRKELGTTEWLNWTEMNWSYRRESRLEKFVTTIVKRWPGTCESCSEMIFLMKNSYLFNISYPTFIELLLWAEYSSGHKIHTDGTPPSWASLCPIISCGTYFQHISYLLE